MNFTMKCVQFRSPFLPLHSNITYNRPFKTDISLLPSSEEITGKVLIRSQKLSIRTRVITNSFILGATSTVHAGDLSVLLQTGYLLLFMYGITNFVVPSFITKNLQLGEVKGESEVEDDSSDDDDNDDDETSMPTRSKRILESSEGVFKGTKTL